MSIKPEIWLRLLEKHGFSTFVATVFLAMLWTGASRVFDELLIPIRDGHLKFMDRVATSTEQSAEGVTSLSQEAKGLRTSMDSLSADVKRALGKIGNNE